MVDADHDALLTHNADTDSGAPALSVGAALALGYSEGGAQATSGMRLNVPSGTVFIHSDSATLLDADAHAGAAGGPGVAAPDVVSEQIEAHIEGLLALAGQDELPEDVIRILQRAHAETADGPIDAAAAIAVNLDFGLSLAALAAGGVLTTSTAPQIHAGGDMDVDASADANSVSSGSGVGVAVAINVDGQRIESALGGTVTAPSIALHTGMTGDGDNEFIARAVSGAGGADLGVAGAFALNVSGNPLAAQDPLDLLAPTGGGQHNARILDGATLNVTGGADLTVSATYLGHYAAIATALPGTGTFGIGPSVAVNAARHTTLAELGAATITGVPNIVVTATGTYGSGALSEAGADNAGAVPAAIALTATHNDTIARVKTGAAQSEISGNLTVTANHTAVANTKADAAAGGAQVGLGAAIAAGGPQGGAVAEAGGNLKVGGSVTVIANTDADTHADAVASQVGAVTTARSADAEVDRQLRRLAEIAGVSQILFPFVEAHQPLQALFDGGTASVDDATDTITTASQHELDTGDMVVYHNNQDDTSVGVLVDGGTYFVSVDAQNTARLRLHATRADAIAGTNPLNLAPIAAPEDNHSLVAERTLNPATAVDGGADTINVGPFAGLMTGDAVKYFNGGATNVLGLEDGGVYYAGVDATDPNALRIKLFAGRAAAMAGSDPINLETGGVTGTTHRILKVVDAYRALGLELDPVTDVTAGADKITRGGITFVTGNTVVYRTNGDDQAIGALVNGQTYFVNVQNDTENRPVSLTLHATLDDANSGQHPINLERTAPFDGRHILEPVRIADPQHDYNNALNTIDFANFQGLETGDALIYRNGGGAHDIAGLVDDTVYYAVVGANNQVQLRITPDAADVIDFDANLALGNAHRFERVVSTAIDERLIPNLRVGAAAAVAIGAGRPESHASIGRLAKLEVTGAVTVTADMDFDSTSKADATSIGGGSLVVGAALAGNYSEGRQIAEIGDGATVKANFVSLSTIGEGDVPYHFSADAASTAGGLGGNVAGAAAVNAANNLSRAGISFGAQVTSATTVDVLANLRWDAALAAFVDAGRFESITRAGELAVGGDLAAGAAAAGTVTLDDDVTEAVIRTGASVKAPNGVQLRARVTHAFDDLGIGGSLSASFAASVGAGFTYVNSTARALVDGGNVTVESGALTLDAYIGNTYSPNGLGIESPLGDIVVAGSLEGNYVANKVEAGIQGAGTIKADSITVKAESDSHLVTDTGAIASSGFVSVGAAAGVNISSTTVAAFAGGGPITTDVGDLEISATTDHVLDAFAAAASSTGFGVAGVGTFTLNSTTNKTDAAIRGGGTTTSARNVVVRAEDTSQLEANGVDLAQSLAIGAGASVAVNKTRNTVTAGIAATTVKTDAGSPDVSATSNLELIATALGATNAGLIAANGSVTINETKNTVEAYLDAGANGVGANIDARDPITLAASDGSTLSADSGSGGIAAVANAGISFAYSKAANEVRAVVRGATTRVETDGAFETSATSTPALTAIATVNSTSAVAAVAGGVSIVETGGTAHSGVLAGQIKATTVSIHATANPPTMDATTKGRATAAVAAASLFVSEGLAGHGAKAEATGTITTNNLNVIADATRNSNPDVSFSQLAVNSGAVAFEAEKTAGTTEALIGAGAVIRIQNDGVVVVKATSNDTADPTADSFAPVVNQISAVASSGETASTTRASISGDVEAKHATASAEATNTADADTSLVSITVLTLDGLLLDSLRGKLPADIPIPIAPPFDQSTVAKNSGAADAFIGSGANIRTTGNLIVTAKSTNKAFATLNEVSANVIAISGSGTGAHATAGGSTKVHIDGGATIAVEQLVTDAFADNEATANGNYVGASGVKINVAEFRARTAHDVAAYLGPPQGTDPSGTAQTLTVRDGLFLMHAKSINSASIVNVAISASAIPINVINPEADAGGSTRAYLGGKFTIDAADGVAAKAESANTAETGAVNLEANAISINAAARAARTSHTTEAFISKKADLSISAALALDADSNNDASIFVTTPIDATAIDIIVIGSTAEAGGSTAAYVEEGAHVTAFSLDAFADSINSAAVDNFAIQAAAIDIEATKPVARTEHATSAFIGPRAGVALNSALQGVLNIGGTVTLKATSTNDAAIDDIDLEAAAISIESLSPEVIAGGTTRTHLGGKFDVNAFGGIVGEATSTNRPAKDTIDIKATAIEINVNNTRLATTHETEAFVAREASYNLGGSSIALTAKSTNDAEYDQFTLEFTAIPITVLRPEVDAAGATRAFVVEGAVINAGGLSLHADSTNTAEIDMVDISFTGISVSSIEPIARTSHTTETYIGPRAGVAPDNNLNGSINVGGGTIDLEATSHNSAEMGTIQLDFSGIPIDAILPEAIAGGKTQAHLGGRFTLSAGSIDATASAMDTKAESDTFQLSISGIPIQDEEAVTRTTHETEAFVAGGASVTIASGALKLEALSSNSASSEGIDISIGLIPIRVLNASAEVAGATRAFVGDNATLSAHDVSLIATSSQNFADADETAVSVGLIQVGTLAPHAEVTHLVQASTAAGSNVDTHGGTLTLTAASTQHANADAGGVGVGIVSVGSLRPDSMRRRLDRPRRRHGHDEQPAPDCDRERHDHHGRLRALVRAHLQRERRRALRHHRHDRRDARRRGAHHRDRQRDRAGDLDRRRARRGRRRRGRHHRGRRSRLLRERRARHPRPGRERRRRRPGREREPAGDEHRQRGGGHGDRRRRGRRRQRLQGRGHSEPDGRGARRRQRDDQREQHRQDRGELDARGGRREVQLRRRWRGLGRRSGWHRTIEPRRAGVDRRRGDGERGRGHHRLRDGGRDRRADLRRHLRRRRRRHGRRHDPLPRARPDHRRQRLLLGQRRRGHQHARGSAGESRVQRAADRQGPRAARRPLHGGPGRERRQRVHRGRRRRPGTRPDPLRDPAPLPARRRRPLRPAGRCADQRGPEHERHVLRPRDRPVHDQARADAGRGDERARGLHRRGRRRGPRLHHPRRLRRQPGGHVPGAQAADPVQHGGNRQRRRHDPAQPGGRPRAPDR